MIFFDLTGIKSAILLATDADHVPERPRPDFFDQLVLTLDFVFD